MVITTERVRAMSDAVDGLIRSLADLGDGSGPAGLQLDAAIRSLEEASARVERVLELTPGPWV